MCLPSLLAIPYAMAQERNPLQKHFPQVALTSPEVTQSLYNLTRKVLPILRESGVHVWATAGTLLGAVRSHGIIPWDDDIDFGMDVREAPKLESARQKLAAAGLELTPHNIGYKIHRAGTSTEKPPFIDIFPYEFAPDGTGRFSKEFCRKKWPRETVIHGEVFPLQEYAFGASTIPGPRDWKARLDRWFGPNWYDQVKVAVPHNQWVWGLMQRPSFWLYDEQRLGAVDDYVA